LDPEDPLLDHQVLGLEMLLLLMRGLRSSRLQPISRLGGLVVSFYRRIENKT
jgi:hypothetical protein